MNIGLFNRDVKKSILHFKNLYFVSVVFLDIFFQEEEKKKGTESVQMLLPKLVFQKITSI